MSTRKQTVAAKVKMLKQAANKKLKTKSSRVHKINAPKNPF